MIKSNIPLEAGVRQRSIVIPVDEDSDEIKEVVIKITNHEPNRSGNQLLRQMDWLLGKAKRAIIQHPIISGVAALSLIGGSMLGLGIVAVSSLASGLTNSDNNYKHKLLASNKILHDSGVHSSNEQSSNLHTRRVHGSKHRHKLDAGRLPGSSSDSLLSNASLSNISALTIAPTPLDSMEQRIDILNRRVEKLLEKHTDLMKMRNIYQRHPQVKNSEDKNKLRRLEALSERTISLRMKLLNEYIKLKYPDKDKQKGSSSNH